MNSFWSVLALLCFTLTTTLSQGAEPSDQGDPNERTISFSRDVRQLLSDRCYLCHGPDEKSRQADLRLDDRESSVEWAIVPGSPDESEVIKRVSSQDPELRMPPPDSNKAPLTSRQIEVLKQWIKEGAEYEKHWAFESPQRPQPPTADRAEWNDSPIDRFVLTKLQDRGWEPSPRADRRTRLRRASLDLTGLPPTPEQIQTFVSDQSTDAWSKAIDRLLSSSAYGEHQARYWLDAARYADSNGYQYDLQREQWAWRDWVIHAFNSNQPFDEFTIEQLAGDLLPDATDQQRLATGFNRNHPITIEGGVIDEEYRVEYVLDRTVTVGTVWMGLTVGCARCHDHKYDPLSQREFYQLSGFFNQVPEKGLFGFAPRSRIPSPYVQRDLDVALEELKVAKTDFREEFEKWNPDQTAIAQKVLSGLDQGWEVLSLESYEASSVAKLTELPDKSILVSGYHSPTEVTYTVVAESDHQQIHGIRLAALTHESLPLGGTSRSDNGNFVLSEIELEAAPKSAPQQFKRIKLTSANADYSQAGYAVARAIDGKIDNSGWAVDGNIPELRTSRFADFRPDKPFGFAEGTRIRIRLRFASQYSNHQIGRFRFSLNSTGDDLDTLSIARILRKPEQSRTAAEETTLDEYIAERMGTAKVKETLLALGEAREQYDRVMARVPQTMIMQEMPEPRGTYVLERGEYDKRREQVQPGTPDVLPAMPNGFPKNRLGFAQWLTMPNHPLTARVVVNRFWQQLFGIGLVDTPEDFGLQSSAPTHAELLDWLAVEFIESGWDMKQLFKTIMLSQAYQQSSAMTTESHARDPQNRFLAHGPRMRLDAETIRDSALAVSGLLHREVGGPSVFPYHPKGLWLEINNRPGYSETYEQDTGDKLYRRSLYTYWKRTVTPPSMAVFDAPSREYCVVNRSRTNTPLQAFVMLHDPQFVEAARALAKRIIREGGNSSATQIQYGFELVVGRQPTPDEQQVLLNNYRKRLKHYNNKPEQAKQLLAIGESSRDQQISLAEHAAMTTVARLLMNLSEFITKG